MIRLLACIASLPLAFGCVLDIPSVNEEGTFPCASAADCEEGYVCAEGFCSALLEMRGDLEGFDRDPSDGPRMAGDTSVAPGDEDSGRDRDGDVQPGDTAGDTLQGDEWLDYGRGSDG